LDEFSFLESDFLKYREKITGGVFPEGSEFKESEKTPEARRRRMLKAQNDYWYFDKTYFPPTYYHDGYAEPNAMLRYIVYAAQSPGIHIILGPRGHGKSPTGKKVLLWLYLTGRLSLAAVFSANLRVSGNMMSDIYMLAHFNPRIKSDYAIDFTKANADQLQFFYKNSEDRKTFCFCTPFSEERSSRGTNKLFDRLRFTLGDDIESNTSSLSTNAVKDRIQLLSETFLSMAMNSTFLIFGNDFSEHSALHRLKLMEADGIGAAHVHVQSFAAWYDRPVDIQLPSIKAMRALDSNRLSRRARLRADLVNPGVLHIKAGPLWPERYPATSEAELREMLQPIDSSDWQGNFMADPTPPEGDFFKRENYKEWSSLPTDIVSVIYCDPNLSKKGKGDTTAIVALGYSPSTDLFYINDAACKSFSNTTDLLDTLLRVRARCIRVAGVGFDGNVNQESHWSEHVKNYSRITRLALPPIQYMHYHVNMIAKNLQIRYDEGKLLFPPEFAKSKDGREFLKQFFSFTGIKKGGLDDAPDALICAHELLYDRNIIRKQRQVTKSIPDFY
jgi:hypothetical protein